MVDRINTERVRQQAELEPVDTAEHIGVLCDEIDRLRAIRDLAWDVNEQVRRNLMEHPEPWFLDTLAKLDHALRDD